MFIDNNKIHMKIQNFKFHFFKLQGNINIFYLSRILFFGFPAYVRVYLKMTSLKYHPDHICYRKICTHVLNDWIKIQICVKNCFQLTKKKKHYYKINRFLTPLKI